MVESGIYAIRNTVNGKAYVGSATVFRKRFSLHRRQLERGDHHAVPLQRAWIKYGRDAFIFEVLERVSDLSLLIEREQHWIDRHIDARAAYNMAKVAGSRLGMKTSSATIEKMKAAAKGRIITDEARAKMREAALARSPEVAAKIAASRPRLVHTAETKARLSEAARGRQFTAEHRARIGAASKGRTHSPETKAKRLETRRARAAERVASA